MKFEGAGLTDYLHFLLFAEAVRLLRTVGEVQRFKYGKDAEGWVRTSRQTGGMGVIYGTKFAATIEHEGGKTEVTYLINDPGPGYDPGDRTQAVAMRYAPIGDAAFIRYLDALHVQQFPADGAPSPDAS